MSDRMFYGCMAGVVALMIFAILYNNQLQSQNQAFFPKPLTADDIKKYGNSDTRAIMIYPIFTQYAYKTGCFYPPKSDGHYPVNITCSLRPMMINGSYVTGYNGFDYLSQLHYPFITDIAVDRHPEILQDYDKIILLHNEYMTKREFEAIKNFKNVVYLYPNSAYAEVSIDYDKLEMTLVRGHQYPTQDIANGFGFVTTTQHEYDFKCEGYKWEARPNGIQPTCWPEFVIKADRDMLQVIKDYPNKVPPLVHQSTITTLPKCNPLGYCENDTKP